MKKVISALFSSMLVLAILIGVLTGCDHELMLHGKGLPTSIPSVTTLPDVTVPKTIPGTLPPETNPHYTQTVPPVTGTIPPITMPTAPVDSYINYSLCTVDADERAAEMGWVCLNDFVELLARDSPYSWLFDASHSRTIKRLILTSLSFSRPVKVCGVELTLKTGVLCPDDEVSYGGTQIDPDSIDAACADARKTSNGNLILPGNTIWLEPTTGEPGRGFGDFQHEMTSLIAILMSGAENGLIEVRIFGTLLPCIEEVRAPTYRPSGVTVLDESDLPYHYQLNFEKNGVPIARFKQSPIYGSLQLPEGNVELMQFAGLNVVRVSREWEPDTYDLYWDDGEYRYQLWGTDEELLLKLAGSIKPM